MDQFPWVDLLTLIIAFSSLIVSIIALYLVNVKRFDCLVLPSRQLMFSWIPDSEEDFSFDDDVELFPGIGLQLEYINLGKGPGRIEDLIVELDNLENGTSHSFIPFLVHRDEIDIYGTEDRILTKFSPTFLKGEESTQGFLFFKPTNKNFKLNSAGSYRVKLLYRVQQTGLNIRLKHTNWHESPIVFTVKVSEKLLGNYQDFNSVHIEAEEIGEIRRKYFAENK